MPRSAFGRLFALYMTPTGVRHYGNGFHAYKRASQLGCRLNRTYLISAHLFVRVGDDPLGGSGRKRV
jgi:hypothetical protein